MSNRECRATWPNGEEEIYGVRHDGRLEQFCPGELLTDYRCIFGIYIDADGCASISIDHGEMTPEERGVYNTWVQENYSFTTNPFTGFAPERNGQ